MSAGLRRASALVLAVALAVVAWWWAHGGRWERVESPSMGTTAPVGSLLWVAPVDARDADEVRVGDVITYRAPGGRHGTYTHRVIERVDGGVRTAGDLTSPDPWVVGPDDVVGEVRLTWRGVGWVVVAAPVLVPGALLALAWAACLPRRRRPAALLVAAAVVVAVGVAVYRPLVGVERIASRPVPGGAEVTVVGTGLLPARVSAGHGPVASTAPTVRVGAGETATLTVRAAPGATLPLRVRADVGATGYLLLAALCLAPALLRRLRGVIGSCSTFSHAAGYAGSGQGKVGSPR